MATESMRDAPETRGDSGCRAPAVPVTASASAVPVTADLAVCLDVSAVVASVEAAPAALAEPCAPDGLSGEIETVLERYAVMVYRLAFARTKSRYDADDILQEVFLRYIRRQPVFREEEHRKAWLIRTTINCSKSLLTSAWFRRISPFPDQLATRMKEKSDVYYAVMALPAKYRTVIHLYYYEEYAVTEIAGLLDCKESTIKSQLHRARLMLRDRLGGEFPDPKGEAIDVPESIPHG